jgi:hypothetical protein
MRRPFLFGIVVVGFAALGACSSLVASTAARLAAMDPLTADPAAIEVALILPPGLQVVQGGATLSIEAQRGDKVEMGQFVLQEQPMQIVGIAVPDGARAITLRITPDDVPRMRATQARIAAWDSDGAAKAKGSFGVGLNACALGDGPSDSAVASLLIRTEAGAPFEPLVRGARLREVLGQQVFDAILPCEGAR